MVAPSTAYDAKGLLKAAIRDDNPVIFIEHQLLYTEKDAVPEEEYTIPLGQAAVRREGTDITVVAYLKMAQVALEAAELLRRGGHLRRRWSTRAPSSRWTSTPSPPPLRRPAGCCASARRPRPAASPSTSPTRCRSACFPHLKAPVKIVAAYDVPPPMAQTLEAENLPDAAKVMRGRKALLLGK